MLPIKKLCSSQRFRSKDLNSFLIPVALAFFPKRLVPALLAALAARSLRRGGLDRLLNFLVVTWDSLVASPQRLGSRRIAETLEILVWANTKIGYRRPLMLAELPEFKALNQRESGRRISSLLITLLRERAYSDVLATLVRMRIDSSAGERIQILRVLSNPYSFGMRVTNARQQDLLNEEVESSVREVLGKLGTPGEISDVVILEAKNLSSELVERVDKLRRQAEDFFVSPSVASLLAPVVSRLVKMGRKDDAIYVFRQIETSLEPKKAAQLRLEILSTGLTAEAKIELFSSERHVGANPGLTLLRAEGRLQEVQEKLVHLERAKVSPARRLALEGQRQRIEFGLQGQKYLETVPNPQTPRGILLLVGSESPDKRALIGTALPVMIEARRMGFESGSLSKGVLPPAGSFDPSNGGHRLFNSPPMNFIEETRRFDLVIDWDNRRADIAGVDLYQGIFESLAATFRTIFVKESLGDPRMLVRLETALDKVDCAFRACQKIEQEAKRLDMPIVLLVGGSDKIPGAVFRDYFLQRPHRNVHLNLIGTSYERLVSKQSGNLNKSISVVNLSKHPDRRLPHLPVPEKWSKWDSNRIAKSQNQDAETDPLIPRRKSLLLWQSPESYAARRDEAQVAHVVNKQRKFCLFGKIPYDLGFVKDGGPAHIDLRDWLNHSIEIAAKHPRIQFFIRPHPHEEKGSIAGGYGQKILELIPRELPSNVLIHDPQRAHWEELVPELTAAIFWAGSGVLELTRAGIPVIVASDAGARDFPIDTHHPSSRDSYEFMLARQDFSEVSHENRRRASSLLDYFKSEELAIPHPYADLTASNDPLWSPVWNHHAMESLIQAPQTPTVYQMNLLTESL